MKLKKYLLSLIIRTFLSIILLFMLAFLLNYSKYSKVLSKVIFTSNIDFSYIRSKTSYLLGKFNGKKDAFISSNKLNYKNITKYKNGYKVVTDNNYILTNIKKGVVTFIGNVNDLGNTVIIQTDEGVNMWFSHIENVNVNVYDYIDEGKVIGSVIDDYFYLLIEDDGKYKSYEEYI